MTADQTPGLQEALNEALRERERLDVVITYLSEKLGRSVDIKAPSGAASAGVATPRVDVATGRVDPLSLIVEGEFYGQNGPSAAASVLRKVGKPNALKTEQLAKAVRKGGVPVASSGTLYRSMIRNSKFRRVGKGLWGLSEWYPPTPPSRTPDPGETEPESEERPETEVT